MKRNAYLTGLLAAAASLLTACGEDRTYQYIAKTEVDHWIEAQMQDVYLYYKDIPQLDTKYYFYPAEEFFPEILASQDKYSYLEMTDEATARNFIQDVSYGFDFVLTDDPTGTTTHRMARVLQVLPESPASQAGVKRGDFITAVNGENITTDNTDLLQSGNGVTLTVSILERTASDSLVWEPEPKELSLTAAVALENNPFFCQKIIDWGGRKVGYLMYNDFKMGTDKDNPDDRTYMEQMLTIFRAFKQQGVNEFVLDLRYNQGGYVNCAQQLASLLAPAGSLGQEFAHFEFNDKRPDLNYALPLQSELIDYNLNLNRLYIITGQYTASASEMMINCLRPYMTVNVLGTKTEGKNVAMTRIDSPYDFVMYPVTSTIYNKDGQSDYADGITPDYTVTELNYFPWGELGEPQQELLLYNVLQWMVAGTPPNAENIEEAETPGAQRFTRTPDPGYSSIRQKGFPAAILQP